MIKNHNRLFVRKENNVERNFERLSALNNLGFSVPHIFRKEGDILDMEYIPGLDMQTYLQHNNEKFLSSFILNLLDHFNFLSVANSIAFI